MKTSIAATGLAAILGTIGGGQAFEGPTGRGVVTGDRDPGYGSTSKMIAESALCLVRDVQGEGVWTRAH
jgi:hypothetical protein